MSSISNIKMPNVQTANVQGPKGDTKAKNTENANPNSKLDKLVKAAQKKAKGAGKENEIGQGVPTNQLAKINNAPKTQQANGPKAFSGSLA